MKRIILLVVTVSLVVGAIFSLGKLLKVKSLSPAADALIKQAQKQEAEGNYLAAKETYATLISNYSHLRNVSEWQKKIEQLNLGLIVSPLIIPGSIEYEIKPGDTLEKIARQYKTTTELLKRMNNLKSEIIYPGKKIKVWTEPFSILVDKSQNTLLLKTDKEIIKTYIVATGVNNSTPSGTFKIVEKIVNPPWFKPGGGVAAPGSPENILGTRWLGLDKPGYGIHGTTDPASLGKQSTAGCVRMSNSDVEELFMLVPQGTEVTIVD
ncbi:MAG: L,D-transpeptidase family protein [Candidatus Omnitrophica bacterium]|nr:L,D-transpeptidase family protein [Candidatus Omnitrophota bacterium]